MKMSEGLAVMLCDGFTQVALEGSMEECLGELSALAARMLSARGCTILLLSEEEVAQAGLRDGTEFGALPRRLGKSRRDLPVAGAPGGKLRATIVRGGQEDMESMVSTIVLHGKIIGVIHACRPLQQSGFSKDDLDLFSILTPLITKSIQVIQLQNILKSRFTQIALTKSNESTIRDLISGAMQNPNQLARILAKSFYREMLSAGFNFNQIIFAATEVISELTLSLRKHSASHKQRGKENGQALELLVQLAGDEQVAVPQPSAGGLENTLAA